MIAHHLNHLDEATEILWEMAAKSSKEDSNRSDAPAHVLEELAEYEHYKDVAFNERMVEFAAVLRHRESAFDGNFTPLDIVDKLLAKEGRFVESIGIQFSIGAFPLRYSVVKPVRQKAIDIIESCLYSDSPKVAHRAVVRSDISCLRRPSRSELSLPRNWVGRMRSVKPCSELSSIGCVPQLLSVFRSS